ncbi:P-loop containing nucleoside triphosphate hydrolase protein [Rhizopogon vinicolor AM-OR11-026]|uniref:p-loop containing nucleoside triphosphate hydrolase protein n=1 Tax=Rhizopogon vinicolor AM-OR11-026 TaxID=1314800 RepID=A0A1B7MVK0_9AGAM|nr:P-loop containing nucleoside triphosphate hydrolase protein [Rhizopogon vinicolor AM-OR11-026]
MSYGAMAFSRSSGRNYICAIASPPINIIVFGESGVGKSSIINMLMGEPVAAVSNQAVGCTYESNKFRAIIAGREVMLYDTAGLNEAEAGTVSPEQAVQNLRSLVTELKTVNLLVYCIRGTRFRKIMADNYEMFCNTICGSDRKVPVVLVVTGLENEENMDDWWEYNKVDFDEMEFRGHACITATRGRVFRDGSGYIFQDLYDGSKEKVTRLLEDHAFESSVTIVPPKNTSTSILLLGVAGGPNLGILSSLLRWCKERPILCLLALLFSCGILYMVCLLYLQ